MKRNDVPEKPLLILPPKYLAGLFLLLVLLFLGTAFFEYHYRKSEIEHMMREEASLLVHALTVGAESAITGYNENRSLLTGSLFDQLRLLDRLDRQQPLTSADLSIIAGSSGLYRINVENRCRSFRSIPACRVQGDLCENPHDDVQRQTCFRGCQAIL